MAQATEKQFSLINPADSRLLRGPDASIPDGMEIFDLEARQPHPGWIHRRFGEIVAGKAAAKRDAQKKKPEKAW
jgi:hypothetical protein